MPEPRRITHEGAMLVEVRIVEDQLGRPSALLQLPSGWVTMHRPSDIQAVASALSEAAAELAEVAEDA